MVVVCNRWVGAARCGSYARDMRLIMVVAASLTTLPAWAAELEGGGIVEFTPSHLARDHDARGKKKERKEFVSVYYSTETGRYGFAGGPTEQTANARAQQKCGSSCTLLGYVKNQCVAAAAGQGKSYGYWFSRNKHEAEQKALEKCMRLDYDCRIFVSACAE